MSLYGLDLTKGSTRFVYIIDLQKHGTNMGSNENLKQLPYLPHGVP
jgi:hypothetical protein